MPYTTYSDVQINCLLSITCMHHVGVGLGAPPEAREMERLVLLQQHPPRARVYIFETDA